MKVLLAALAFCSSFPANSQLTKKTWLLGGNVSFTNYRSASALGTNRESVFQSSGNAGYFFIDKLAVGIRPNLYTDHANTNNNRTWSNGSSIGPFVRYYFLGAEETIKLFLEGNYAYGTDKVQDQQATHRNSFSIVGGPVWFLNSIVGLELSVGYTHTTAGSPSGQKANIFRTAIGFQFHLEKE